MSAEQLLPTTNPSSPRSRRTCRKPPRLSCSNSMIPSGKRSFLRGIQRLRPSSCWTALQTRVEAAIWAQAILFPFACVCVPIAILAIFIVWSCVVVFTAAVSVDISSCSVEADDRSKGEGWQSQWEQGWLAVQVRVEEILTQAVTIDGGRDSWYCR